MSSSAARAEASSASNGSTPRSNRREASEPKIWFLELRAIDIGSKWAASSVIATVNSLTSLSSPPIVPARARTFLSSVIRRLSLASFRLTLSSVTNSVNLPALATLKVPDIFALSKACSG